jgi:hypothetical protein
MTIKTFVLVSPSVWNQGARCFVANMRIGRAVRILRSLRNNPAMTELIDVADIKDFTEVPGMEGYIEDCYGFVCDDRVGGASCAGLRGHSGWVINW